MPPSSAIYPVGDAETSGPVNENKPHFPQGNINKRRCTMTLNMTRTTLLGTTFAALLIAFAATVNAQGFDANRRPEPNRTMAQPASPFATNRPSKPAPMPQAKPSPMPQHGMAQFPSHNQPRNFQTPQHHASHPAPAHHYPTVTAPKPAPIQAMHIDHHCTPAPQPQVVVVGQPPRKPSLLEKIVDIFR